MLSTKFLIVLCLGVLAAQAKPQLAAPIDDLERELEELEREVEEEKHRAQEQLGGELRDLAQISEETLHRLEEELQRGIERSISEINNLEERARQSGVDIRQCVGNSLDEINELPRGLLDDARQCLDGAHGEADRIINEGVRHIEEAAGHVEQHRREADRCRQAEPREQEQCINQLSQEIRNDRTQIPHTISTAVDTALGELEFVKPDYFRCSEGLEERLNQEAEQIVRRVTECADRILPPNQPTPFK